MIMADGEWLIKGRAKGKAWQPKDDEVFDAEPTVKECLEDILEAIKCRPVDTCKEVIEGPLCGLRVKALKNDDGLFIPVEYNPETKTFEEIDLMANTLGIPAPENKNTSCIYERVAVSVCAPTEEVVLAPADILALITGEVFNDAAATAVDIAAVEQDLINAEVQGFPCNSVVKHEDGAFTVLTAEACVDSASGDTFNLQQGGSAILGDSRPNDDRPIVIDETVTVPVGSAVRLCFDVKLYLDAAGAPVASIYAASGK